jgi:hypothetical protein
LGVAVDDRGRREDVQGGQNQRSPDHGRRNGWVMRITRLLAVYYPKGRAFVMVARLVFVVACVAALATAVSVEDSQLPVRPGPVQHAMTPRSWTTRPWRSRMQRRTL